MSPRGNEFAQAVGPKIFVHGYGDKNAASNGLVAVDGIRAGYSWKSSDLDSDGGITDHHDYLEVLVLIRWINRDIQENNEVIYHALVIVREM